MKKVIEIISYLKFQKGLCPICKIRHWRIMKKYGGKVMNTEKEPKEIFFNRAEAESGERMSCDNYFESTVFLLRDSTHEFSLGLSSVLECVEFAIKNGDLPKLPKSWCKSVEDTYNVEFDEDISFRDEECRKSMI